MEYLWVLFAVLSSMFVAAVGETNRYYRMDGVRINFWRTAVIAFWLAPAVFFIDLSHGWAFYAAGAIMGVSMFVCMNILMSLAANGQGRSSQIYQPVKALGVFLLWLAIDNEALQRIIENPLRTGLIVASFLLATLAMQRIRNNDSSWKVFIAVIPVIILFGLSDILIKLVMPSHLNFQASMLLVWVANLSCCVCGGIYLAFRHAPDKPLLPPKMLRAAVQVGFFAFGAFATVNLAIAGSPNPAYVSMICFLTPFWIQLWHKLTDHKDEADSHAILLLVFSAILIVAVTNFM